jgi:hypothetical protein
VALLAGLAGAWMLMGSKGEGGGGVDDQQAASEVSAKAQAGAEQDNAKGGKKGKPGKGGGPPPKKEKKAETKAVHKQMICSLKVDLHPLPHHHSHPPIHPPPIHLSILPLLCLQRPNLCYQDELPSHKRYPQTHLTKDIPRHICRHNTKNRDTQKQTRKESSDSKRLTHTRITHHAPGKSQGHSSDILSFRFSGSCKVAASVAEDRKLIVWDFKSLPPSQLMNMAIELVSLKG